MPSNAKLPEPDVLRQLADLGKSNREIAEIYDVTPEAVRSSMVRHGIQPRVMRRRYVPWRGVRADHQSRLIARTVRAAYKDQDGVPLTTTERRRLESFLAYVNGGNPWGKPLAVHYDRDDPEGFWLEERRPTDNGFISPPHDQEPSWQS